MGFLINDCLKEKVRKFLPVSERLCYIELRGEMNWSILNAYPPTEDKDDHLKDDFYEKLKDAYSTLNKRIIRMLMRFKGEDRETSYI